MKFLRILFIYFSLVFILSSCSDHFDDEAYKEAKQQKPNTVHETVVVLKSNQKQEAEAKRLEETRIAAKRLYAEQLEAEVKELEQQIEAERVARIDWLKGLKSPHELEVERVEARAKRLAAEAAEKERVETQKANRLEQEKLYWHKRTEQDQILQKAWIECREKEEEAKKEAKRLETRRRSDEIYAKLSKKYKEEAAEYWNSLKSSLGWG